MVQRANGDRSLMCSLSTWVASRGKIAQAGTIVYAPGNT